MNLDQQILKFKNNPENFYKIIDKLGILIYVK